MEADDIESFELLPQITRTKGMGGPMHKRKAFLGAETEKTRACPEPSAC